MFWLGRVPKSIKRRILSYLSNGDLLNLADLQSTFVVKFLDAEVSPRNFLVRISDPDLSKIMYAIGYRLKKSVEQITLDYRSENNVFLQYFEEKVTGFSDNFQRFLADKTKTIIAYDFQWIGTPPFLSSHFPNITDVHIDYSHRNLNKCYKFFLLSQLSKQNIGAG